MGAISTSSGSAPTVGTHGTTATGCHASSYLCPLGDCLDVTCRSRPTSSGTERQKVSGIVGARRISQRSGTTISTAPCTRTVQAFSTDGYGSTVCSASPHRPCTGHVGRGEATCSSHMPRASHRYKLDFHMAITRRGVTGSSHRLRSLLSSTHPDAGHTASMHSTNVRRFACVRHVAF